MSSYREQILVAAVAALNAATLPAGVPTTERSRSIDVVLTDAAPASMSLYPVRETVQEIGGGAGPVVRLDFRMRLEIRHRGTAAARPETLADVLLVHAVKRLAGNRLGGLALDIKQADLDFEFGQSDAPYVLVAQDFVVDYHHLVSNPEARA